VNDDPETYVIMSGPRLTPWQRLWWAALRWRWAPRWLQRIAWQEVLGRRVDSVHTIDVPDRPEKAE